MKWSCLRSVVLVHMINPKQRMQNLVNNSDFVYVIYNLNLPFSPWRQIIGLK